MKKYKREIIVGILWVLVFSFLIWMLKLGFGLDVAEAPRLGA